MKNWFAYIKCVLCPSKSSQIWDNRNGDTHRSSMTLTETDDYSYIRVKQYIVIFSRKMENSQLGRDFFRIIIYFLIRKSRLFSTKKFFQARLFFRQFFPKTRPRYPVNFNRCLRGMQGLFCHKVNISYVGYTVCSGKICTLPKNDVILSER